MATYLYDEQLVEKLSNWYSGTDLHIYSPANTRRLWETIADETDDEPIKLPILCLSRSGGYTVNNVNKKPATYEGLKLTSGITDKNIVLYSIPITINYQLDIYSRYFEEADQFARDLVFNIINHPTINLDIEYNGIKINHNATLRMASEVSDNSDVAERFIAGNFTRLTLKLNLDDAYLWNIKQKGNARIKSIEIEAKVKND